MDVEVNLFTRDLIDDPLDQGADGHAVGVLRLHDADRVVVDVAASQQRVGELVAVVTVEPGFVRVSLDRSQTELNMFCNSTTGSGGRERRVQPSRIATRGSQVGQQPVEVGGDG